jgi:hypothetical protein
MRLAISALALLTSMTGVSAQGFPRQCPTPVSATVAAELFRGQRQASAATHRAGDSPKHVRGSVANETGVGALRVPVRKACVAVDEHDQVSQ